MQDFGLLVARYNASLPTLADGLFTQLQVDVNGRLLVQADVSVLIDFLGLNGASDSANMLIVGTEDGTATGTPHAFKLAADGSLTVVASNLDIRDLVFATDKVDASGSVIALDATTLAALESITVQNGAGASAVNIQDGGNSITVDAVNLDIRDLAFATDKVDVSGSSVDASIVLPGAEAYAETDAEVAAADGLITIVATATPWADSCSIAVGAGQTLYLYGYEWSCDQNANARIISDDTTDIIVYKHSLNSSSMPSQGLMFGDNGRIEIVGAASKVVKLQIKKRSAIGGNANGFGSIHARIV